MENLKADVKQKFEAAGETFKQVEDDGARNDLQLFSFICELAFDVFLKKQLIEMITDQLREENPAKKKK